MPLSCMYSIPCVRIVRIADILRVLVIASLNADAGKRPILFLDGLAINPQMSRAMPRTQTLEDRQRYIDARQKEIENIVPSLLDFGFDFEWIMEKFTSGCIFCHETFVVKSIGDREVDCHCRSRS